MRVAAVVIGVMLASAVLVADDHTVLFDKQVNFAGFKTFRVHDGTVGSQRPELNSSIAIKKLTNAIRGGLISKGLTEAATGAADLLVEYDVRSVDWGIGPFGRANPINTGRGRRGSPETLQADFTDATLVVDLKTGNPPVLVWRGVYNDSEPLASTLADELPKDAAKLLSEFPPKKK